jgi:hypothetical protein
MSKGTELKVHIHPTLELYQRCTDEIAHLQLTCINLPPQIGLTCTHTEFTSLSRGVHVALRSSPGSMSASFHLLFPSRAAPVLLLGHTSPAKLVF